MDAKTSMSRRAISDAIDQISIPCQTGTPLLHHCGNLAPLPSAKPYDTRHELM